MGRKSKTQARQRMIILLITILAITIGSVLFGSSFSSAHENTAKKPLKRKCYKSIVIQTDDTLWDIARQYKTDAYESTQEYIDELKQINSLDSDIIYENQRLLVAYFK